jgi:hypothetical protein
VYNIIVTFRDSILESLSNKVINIKKGRRKMSEKKTQKKSNKKCKIKCQTCQFYISEDDYCSEKDIEYCTKQTNMNFSKCDNYLVKENLVMF